MLALSTLIARAKDFAFHQKAVERAPVLWGGTAHNSIALTMHRAPQARAASVFKERAKISPRVLPFARRNQIAEQAIGAITLAFACPVAAKGIAQTA
jgi:hypothetical protein